LNRPFLELGVVEGMVEGVGDNSLGGEEQFSDGFANDVCKGVVYVEEMREDIENIWQLERLEVKKRLKPNKFKEGDLEWVTVAF